MSCQSAMTAIASDPLDELIATVHWLGQQGWCPATGGNFSVRQDAARFLITASGRDKTRLLREDFLSAPVTGELPRAPLAPSAETALHQMLYRLEASIGCVLHTHTVAATVLSRQAEDALCFSGYEMQKAISGNITHAAELRLPVLENTQDIPALAQIVSQRWAQAPLPYGFLVRGHGLYAWGANVAEARRHVEGWEFLCNCLLTERLLSIRA